jgi:O-antigen ligase
MFGPITQRLLRSKIDSTTAREIYKADARRMIAASPWVGVGLNSYVFALQDYASMKLSSYGEAPPTVHNIFYLWWAETGIVGMLLFCSVWGSIIWTGFANLTVKNETLFAINAACLAAMIALIPDSFLSFTLRVNTMLRLFWILAGMILAVRYLRMKEQRSLSAPVIVEAHAPPAP